MEARAGHLVLAERCLFAMRTGKHSAPYRLDRAPVARQKFARRMSAGYLSKTAISALGAAHTSCPCSSHRFLRNRSLSGLSVLVVLVATPCSACRATKALCRPQAGTCFKMVSRVTAR